MSSPKLDPEQKLSWNLGEFALLTGFSTDYLRDRIKQGNLRARKVSRLVVILKRDGLNWLDSLPEYKPEQEQGTEPSTHIEV